MTNAWTRIAEYPIKNGITAMARFRVAPDATRLAFNEYRPDGFQVCASSVWLRDLRADAEPRKISDIGGRPIWSADGKQLLVVEVIAEGPGNLSEPHRFAMWRIDADGSHTVRLPVPKTDQVSDWSSDGQWLVGVSPIPGKETEHAWENIIMHPDGTGRRRLPGPGVGYEARFSPDGKRIAYVTAAKDQWNLKGKSVWIVGIDGKDRRSIYMEPDNVYLEDVVNWSPDGKQLVTVLQTWTHLENGTETPRNPPPLHPQRRGPQDADRAPPAGGLAWAS